ncbi:MAG: hypothetical protein L0216_06415 [Planctomycetales bacterium]|nr:hypothetical protein [Planctomycetales bacterium]
MRLAGVLALLLAAAGTAAAHEPIHGVGPNTLWRGGTAVELEFEAGLMETLRHGSHRAGDPSRGAEQEGMVALHLAHGVTQDLLVFTALPLAFAREREDGDSEWSLGAGDVELGAKWRFWRRQTPGRALMGAAQVAVNLPTGRVSTDPPLGSGRPSVELALAAARDALDFYLWGDVRVQLPVPGRRDRVGFGAGADAAFGLRAWLPEYRGTDLVFLLEAGVWGETPGTHRGDLEDDSGGAWAWAGPGMLFFWDRFEAKLGVRVPLWRWSRGRQRMEDVGLAAGVGVMF